MKQQSIVYTEADGTVVYRAYSLGGCIRSLVAARLGETAEAPNAQFQERLDASSDAEAKAIAAYRIESGHEVIWQQKKVELKVSFDSRDASAAVYGMEIIVRGHIDGLDQDIDDTLEVKSFGDNYFDLYNRGGLDALPGMLGIKYRWQGGIYGHATERKVRYVVFNKTEVGEHAGDLIIEPAVHPDTLVTLDEIRERIQMVEEFAARDELPECDRKCGPMDGFAHVHPRKVVTEGDDDLLDLLEGRELLKNTLGAVDKKKGVRWGLLGRLEDVNDDIKQRYGPGTHTVGPYTAYIVERAGTERVDGLWLKKNHPEIYEASLKMGEPSVSLTVKRRQERESD